jgi:ankyrin repeat protein
VTLPLAAGMSDIAALELLRAHGANVNHPWATDGGTPLYEILHWAGSPDGARWLIAHGAACDAIFAGNGETALHVVAESWGPDLAELLVAHGADVNRRRTDGRTPYAVAELSGNRAMADWLAAHGADANITDVDRFVAACSRGDRAVAGAMLERQPGLRAEISTEHYRAFYRAAERNDAAAIETMLACGFEIDRPDESIGKTALHVAAMEGWPDAARVLLAHGASVSVRDREFQAQPLIWAAEGARTSRTDRDHATVGRLLLDAGSPVEWEPGAEPAEPILDIVNAWRGITPE